jgi:hypothetical protein
LGEQLVSDLYLGILHPQHGVDLRGEIGRSWEPLFEDGDADPWADIP